MLKKCSTYKEIILLIVVALNASCESELQQEYHDSQASHRVLLICDGEALIGLRLKFDSGYQAFHILGYWTTGL